MKSRFSLPGFNLLLLSCISSANAAVQTWQTANATNTWNLGATNWDAGVAWANGNDATFSGTAETVTVGADTLTVGSITLSGTGSWAWNGTLGNLSATTLNVNTTGAGKLGLTGTLSTIPSVNVSNAGTLFLAGGTNMTTAVSVTGTGNSENRGAIRLDNGASLSGSINLTGNTTFGNSSSTAGTSTVNAGISGNFGISIASTSPSSINFAGPLTFTGGFTQNPASTASPINTISGTANTYAGATTISKGTLNLTGSIPNSALSIGAAGKLSGEGTAASATFANGATLNFDPTTAGAFTSTGTLSIAGADIVTLTPTVAPPSGTQTILNHGGTTATQANFVLSSASSYRNPVIAVGASNVTLTTDPGVALTWSGTNNAFWEAGVNDLNWNGGTANFFQGDSITFDDNGANPAITMIGLLTPASFTVNNSNVNYSFTGTGLSGTTGITKSGSGSLSLAGTNSYTGSTTITGGTFVAGSATALGAITGATNVSGGGTLDVNAMNLGAEPVVISGSGVGGNGAIINSNATQQIQALRFVTLSGDAAIGGSGRWDIRANTTATLDLAGHKLTKVGANYFPIVSANITDGDIDVNEGTLGISVNTTVNGSGTLRANNGGSLETAYVTTAANITRNIVLNGGSITSVSGSNGANSNITLTADSTLGGNGGTLTLNGAISESGGARKLTKTGTSTFILTNPANSWTGGTEIDSGIVVASSSTAFGSGAVTMGGAVANNRIQLGNGVNVANALTVNSSIGATGRGLLEVTGTNNATWSGPINVTGGPSSGGLLYTDAGASLTLTGPVTATGQFFVLRAGNLTLSGGGSYSYFGVTGTARVGATNGISTQAVATLGVSGAAVLDLNGFDQTLAGLSKATGTGTGTGTVQNSVAGTKTLTIDYNGGTAATYAGTIVTGTGEIALTKTGTGTFVLSGANTYAGTTTVGAGTLSITTASLVDTADVRITTGATLDLNHALTDTVRSLYLDGVGLAPGTYGSLTSTATNKVAYITGNGILNVTTGASGYAAWASTNAGGQSSNLDFDKDGMPNAVEYLMGQTGSGVTANPNPVNGIITWPKDPTANATWVVKISSDLIDWDPALTGVTDNGTSIQYVLPPNAGRIFARLEVTAP